MESLVDFFLWLHALFPLFLFFPFFFSFRERIIEKYGIQRERNQTTQGNRIYVLSDAALILRISLSTLIYSEVTPLELHLPTRKSRSLLFYISLFRPIQIESIRSFHLLATSMLDRNEILRYGYSRDYSNTLSWIGIRIIFVFVLNEDKEDVEGHLHLRTKGCETRLVEPLYMERVGR